MGNFTTGESVCDAPAIGLLAISNSLLVSMVAGGDDILLGLLVLIYFSALS
jgi:hypothetical protein